jgi:hypothetical protein
VYRATNLATFTAAVERFETARCRKGGLRGNQRKQSQGDGLNESLHHDTHSTRSVGWPAVMRITFIKLEEKHQVLCAIESL